ncbi:hypothetical protein [Streptomyces sp. NPDC000656]
MHVHLVNLQVLNRQPATSSNARTTT